ncbi:DNRLRE domain-containing protein [Phytomonospora sp. NPDC050363]|uniref:CBM96 family carbohydrate-binding protein n=1 Tax=Phytomonospora sp. NPDC050363 TaxID=3155642 RepID=UPI00340BE4C8
MKDWRRMLTDTFGLQNRRSRRRLTFAVIVPVAATGFGLGYVVGFGRAGGPQPAAEFTATGVDAEADTYVRSAEPEATGGGSPELLVGGSSEVGVASAYVRFTVTEAPVRDAKLEFSIVESDPGQLLEVIGVDGRWDEATMSAAEVPPFGRAFDASSSSGSRVVFDVSKVVTGVGVYAFAVTSPDEDLLTRLHSREGGTAPRLNFRVPVTPSPSLSLSGPSASQSTRPEDGAGQSGPCEIGVKLVPTCGALWGVAPGSRTSEPRIDAIERWERRTGRPQDIFHAYHRGDQLFPTEEELEIARNPDRPRLLFLNWKPRNATWAEIAAGDKDIDAYLDRLAAHIKSTFNEPFFFTVHHEPENDVDARKGSGRTAADYAAMYRYVIEYLRGKGVSNLVTVMVYMAYLGWSTKPWHRDLYPGDDVVDWVSWDAYAYSDKGYGFGDFAEMVDRADDDGAWPGYYRWAAQSFPDKPLMLAEWGIWRSNKNPGHQATFLRQALAQLAHFPRLKALVYFETPNDRGKDSRIDKDPLALTAYRELGLSRHFQVRIP